MDSMNEVRARARQLAAQWFKAQCQDPYAAFYLYVRPASASVFGDLLVAQDGPEGCELAWARKDLAGMDTRRCQALDYRAGSAPTDLEHLTRYSRNL